MKVELIDHMGSDLSVVNAARVSFDKVSIGTDRIEIVEDVPAFARVVRGPTDADVKLIQYLAKHNHWSPFSHAFLSFRIKAPIFVARQLGKHQVGLAWNEVSRRYVDSEPEFYQPDTWRKRAENVKQGSSDEVVKTEDGYTAYWSIDNLYGHQLGVYKRMLDMGMCPEQARMVLPQSMMTEWIWSGSLYAFARVCKLRLDGHTQAETRVVATYLAQHCETLFPASWKALMGVSDD